MKGFYELCQNTRDSSTRRVSVVRGSDLHYCNGCCYVWIFSSFIDNDKEKKKRCTRMVRTKS